MQDTFGKVISSANPFYQGSKMVDTENYFFEANKSSQVLAYPVFNTIKLKMVNLLLGKQMTIDIGNIKGFLKNCKSVVL
jgi:hypothetical protein